MEQIKPYLTKRNIGIALVIGAALWAYFTGSLTLANFVTLVQATLNANQS